jgi:hypothetical protein
MALGVEVEDVAIPVAADPPHRVFVRIYRAAAGTLPVVVYLPSSTAQASADGLARRLVVSLPVAVVLPETSLDPGGEGAFDSRAGLAGWLAQHGGRRGLDGSRGLSCGAELELAFDTVVDVLKASLGQGSGESSGNLGVGS